MFCSLSLGVTYTHSLDRKVWIIQRLRSVCDGIKMQLPFLLVAVLVYVTNKLVLIPMLQDSQINWFLTGYLNDLFAPLAFFALINTSFALSKLCMSSIMPILILSVIAGIAWEFFPNTLRQTAVSDWIDIGCYIIGSISYYLALKRILKWNGYPIST